MGEGRGWGSGVGGGRERKGGGEGVREEREEIREFLAKVVAEIPAAEVAHSAMKNQVVDREILAPKVPRGLSVKQAKIMDIA